MKDVFTTNAPAAIGPYTQAKVVGNMVYTSGQIAIVPATGNLAEGGIEAGSDLAKVVKTTCFLKDINDFAAFNAVYGEYFTTKPARSCVGGLSLPKGALVEVEVIAEV